MNGQARKPCTQHASAEPAPDAQLPMEFTLASVRVCPFCDESASATLCSSCGRDPTAPRVVCPCCNKMSPSEEPDCCRCGERRKNELRWKVPLVIALFVLAFAIAIVVSVLLDRALH